MGVLFLTVQAIMLVKAEAERRGDRHPSEQLQIPLNVQHLAARWGLSQTVPKPLALRLCREPSA